MTSQLYETEILHQNDLPQAGLLQLQVWNNYLFVNKNGAVSTHRWQSHRKPFH